MTAVGWVRGLNGGAEYAERGLGQSAQEDTFKLVLTKPARMREPSTCSAVRAIAMAAFPAPTT